MRQHFIGFSVSFVTATVLSLPVMAENSQGGSDYCKSGKALVLASRSDGSCPACEKAKKELQQMESSGQKSDFQVKVADPAGDKGGKGKSNLGGGDDPFCGKKDQIGPTVPKVMAFKDGKLQIFNSIKEAKSFLNSGGSSGSGSGSGGGDDPWFRNPGKGGSGSASSSSNSGSSSGSGGRQ
jgi:hypothetical protein